MSIPSPKRFQDWLGIAISGFPNCEQFYIIDFPIGTQDSLEGTSPPPQPWLEVLRCLNISMRILEGAAVLSATDLANHLSCRHITSLELRLAKGQIAEPTWQNPHAHVLRQRGLEHERAYIDWLRAKASRPLTCRTNRKPPLGGDVTSALDAVGHTSGQAKGTS